MKNEWTELLSDYLDDELSPAARSELEQRFREDAELRETLEGLRQVRDLAGNLPDDPPASNLWPGIESRLDTAVVPLESRRRVGSSRFAFTAPQLAAAAIAMVLLGGSLTYAVQQGGGPSSAEGPGVAVVMPDAPDALPVGSPVSATATMKYEAAISELARGLAEGRERLDPETIRVIDSSLAKIDLAIEEAGTALEADPASEYLSRHLTGAMTRKRDVLLQANELVRAQT